LFYSSLNLPTHQATNTIWLKNQQMQCISLTKSCQILNNTIYNIIICYCQVKAKLMPKISANAKLKNLMTNSKNDVVNKHAKLSNEKFLQPSFFKIPNLTYTAF